MALCCESTLAEFTRTCTGWWPLGFEVRCQFTGCWKVKAQPQQRAR